MRFPGFTEEWAEIKLSDIAEKINSGKTPLGGESVYLSEGIVFIRSQNVNNEKLELVNSVYISKKVNATMKNSVVKPNDILLNITGASLGRSCVVPDDFELGNVNQHVCIIRLKENYNPRFLQPIFSSAKGQSIFESLQTGSGREGLNFDSIKKIIIKIPEADEQLKIASFLSLLNKRIETQSKIIQQLESSIRILRENLFNQKNRFKDSKGHEFPDWKVKKLGEFAIKKSSNISANKIQENFGEYIIYGASGILKKIDFYEEDSDYISIVKDGAGVGRLLYCEGKSSVLGTMDIIKPVGDISAYFLFCLLSIIDFTKYITGSTIPHIYFKDYKNESFGIPCVEEQRKISNALLFLYEKVQIEKNILEKFESQKRHLLINMFI